MRLKRAVEASENEKCAVRPGDELIAVADVIMDRAFTVDAPPPQVWPWLVQLGKHRAGWYLPRRVERLLPRAHRAVRHLEPRWLDVKVGEVIPDYGGRHATFQVAQIIAPCSLVYTSQRGKTSMTWSITLETGSSREQTRICLRLRMAPVRHLLLARTAGGFLDMLTIAGLAAGLRERAAPTSAPKL